MNSVSDAKLVTNAQLDTAFTELEEAIQKKILQFIWIDERNPDDSELAEVTRFIGAACASIFKQPNPLEFDPIAESLRAVAIAFGADVKDHGIKLGFGDPDLDAIQSAQIDMGRWRGEFGESMRYEYLERLPGIAVNHGGVCMYQLDRTITLGHIYARYRWDAWNIATQATAAVESLTESHSADVLIGMAVVIAVGTLFTGVGGIIEAGLAQKALALGGSSLIIGGTLGGALAPSDADKVPLGGRGPHEVAANIATAFVLNDRQLDDELAEFQNTLEEFAEELDKYMAMPTTREHPLRPIMPAWSGDVEEDLVIHYK
ncbi:MAG: hypothetical protein ACRD0P_06115 [Stackebrandtia sp.]